MKTIRIETLVQNLSLCLLVESISVNVFLHVILRLPWLPLLFNVIKLFKPPFTHFRIKFFTETCIRTGITKLTRTGRKVLMKIITFFCKKHSIINAYQGFLPPLMFFCCKLRNIALECFLIYGFGKTDVINDKELAAAIN